MAPPSFAAARMAATCGMGLNNAMATGVNMLGDVHGGAGEQAIQRCEIGLDFVVGCAVRRSRSHPPFFPFSLSPFLPSLTPRPLCCPHFRAQEKPGMVPGDRNLAPQEGLEPPA